MSADARFRLADHGQFFATRAKARSIREQIETAPPDQLITLDFAEVATMTVSFGDELVGKLACGGWKLIIESASDDLWDTVLTVLRRRGLAPVVRADGPCLEHNCRFEYCDAPRGKCETPE